ncbi:MAG TPA: hypothetical protein VMZ91_03515 [Candidatus Paceibacterota bacterium]|nr:hypothetical protein [Candidatus Paceibacterota bacterium]
MTVNCALCKQEIVKYKMDLGDTIILKIKFGEDAFICDGCAKEIARQLLDR